MLRKNIFLTLSIGILSIILSWHGYSYIQNKKKSNFHGYDIESGDFFSTSSHGQAYNLKANYITNIGKNLYKLNKVYARYCIDKENDKYTEAVSKTGMFDESKNFLSLTGDVEFILSQGYRMTTNLFFIDMKKNIAFTKEEVLISGIQGKILSKNGITVYMKKEHIILHGPIQSVFIENNTKNR
ncbi:MAG: LPS export ABC transporter periplasmic protein LptC [Rickettsiales bacterium]|nr:LPS export ABC transporter periplasmic protein LptC [Rickettsiales bacterium]